MVCGTGWWLVAPQWAGAPLPDRRVVAWRRVAVDYGWLMAGTEGIFKCLQVFGLSYVFREGIPFACCFDVEKVSVVVVQCGVDYGVNV